MIDNEEHTTNSNNIQKSKYAFIGFLIGITPFILILCIISLNEGGIKYIPNIFRNTIVIFGIITAFINSYVLSKMLMNKFDD